MVFNTPPFNTRSHSQNLTTLVQNPKGLVDVPFRIQDTVKMGQQESCHFLLLLQSSTDLTQNQRTSPKHDIISIDLLYVVYVFSVIRRIWGRRAMPSCAAVTTAIAFTASNISNLEMLPLLSASRRSNIRALSRATITTHHVLRCFTDLPLIPVLSIQCTILINIVQLSASVVYVTGESLWRLRRRQFAGCLRAVIHFLACP